MGEDDLAYSGQSPTACDEGIPLQLRLYVRVFPLEIDGHIATKELS